MTLAKNSTTVSAESGGDRRTDAQPTLGPWSLVAVSLADSSVISTRSLPQVFTPSLDACAHTIAVDGGNIFYVTAVVAADTDSDRLVTVQYSGDITTVVLNISVPSIGLGIARVKYPSSVIGPLGRLWHQLSDGVAGFDLQTGKRVAAIPLPTGSTLSGLCCAWQDSRIYGVLTTARGTFHVASFDPAVKQPVLRQAPDTLPRVLRGGSAATLLADLGQMSVLGVNDSNHSHVDLVTVDLNGTLLWTVPATTPPPSGMMYEPFVF